MIEELYTHIEKVHKKYNEITYNFKITGDTQSQKSSDQNYFQCKIYEIPNECIGYMTIYILRKKDGYTVKIWIIEHDMDFETINVDMIEYNNQCNKQITLYKYDMIINFTISITKLII